MPLAETPHPDPASAGPPSPEPPADAAWALIRAVADSPETIAAKHAFLREVGLTDGPVRVLRAVLELGPAPMSVLATHLGCDKSYVTGLVKALRPRRLVEVTGDSADGRLKVVRLTDEGALIAQRSQDLVDTVPAGLRSLSRADVVELAALLRKAASSTDQPEQ